MKILVCLGTGGVGKTSISAAAALKAASEGDRALVLTIDPAQRLRTSLGLETTTDQQKVDLPGTLDAPGELWAAILDVRSVLDRAVGLYSDPDQAERILKHPIYHTLISALSGMQELLAIERLDQAIADGFETIVIDTAPSRHALEFLDKPDFFAQLASLPLVRFVGRTFRFWEKLPLSRLSRSSLEAYSRLESLLGSQLLRQVLDFYSVFIDVAEGYAERAVNNAGLLRNPEVTSFWIVSTPFKAQRDADYFLEELGKRRFPVEALTVNRVWPSMTLPSTTTVESVLLSRSLEWYRAVSQSHQEALEVIRNDYGSRIERILSVPEMETDVSGLAALIRLAGCLR